MTATTATPTTPAPKPTARRRPELRWHAEHTITLDGVTRRPVPTWTTK